jgi:hypothetical protein
MIMRNACASLVLVLVICSARLAFGDPEIRIDVFPEPGWVAVEATYGSMMPLPKGSFVQVRILDAKGSEALPEKLEKLHPRQTTFNVILDARPLQPTDYRIRTSILAPDGSPIGEPVERPASWPGQAEDFKGIKILNNVVWELLKAEQETVDGTRSYVFKSPKRRWVYVATTARASGGTMRISLNEYEDIISFEKGEKATKEAMRFLPKGEHKLIVSAEGGCEIESLVIRSIPELILHELGGLHSYNGDSGMSALDFYETYVMDNVNTFIADVRNPALRPTLEKWKREGGRVLANAVALGVAHGITYYPPEKIYEYLSSTVGLTDPLADGTTLDEFSGGCVNCPSYAEALRKLKATPKFKDKLVYFYDTNIEFNGEQGLTRLKAMVETDSVFMWERYLSTSWDKYLPKPTELAARDFLRTTYGLVDMARTCRKWVPDAIEHLAVCFGFFSAPGGHTQATTPYVNLNVWLDMQFNVVANDPAFWGTYGLMGYHSSYSDEETLRWMSKLFRHYGIEGGTGPATSDPYRSPHLVNGDFVDGMEGWTVTSAEPNSIRAAGKPGLSALQTRYSSSEGDTGLVATRSPKGPNTITQEIKNLEPGRLYTFRMIACDYEDMSKRERPAVSVTLDSVGLIPNKSFAAVFPDVSFVAPIEEHKTWLTYYWYLFRATDKTGRVTITDWAAENEPGGPIAQQLIFNYIQVHPYYSPEDE